MYVTEAHELNMNDPRRLFLVFVWIFISHVDGCSSCR